MQIIIKNNINYYFDIILIIIIIVIYLGHHQTYLFSNIVTISTKQTDGWHRTTPKC